MIAPTLNTPNDFINHILNQFYQDIETQVENNYDWDRFSPDGIDRSESRYTELHTDTLKSIILNARQYFTAWLLLEDSASRHIYIDLIRYRLAGHRHVKLPTNTPEFWARCEYAKQLPSAPCALTSFRALGIPFYKRVVPFEGHEISVCTNNVMWPFLQRQYFLEREAVRIRPERGDYIIDGGAGIGDTALALGAAAGCEGKVYAFEMVQSHIAACYDNLALNPNLSQFQIFECGLSDEVCIPQVEKAVVNGFMPGYSLNIAAPEFPTSTIDSLVSAGAIERVDFIKLDIEGAELAALQGAEETLAQYKPKLAISLYHKTEDFYEIPLYLSRLGLGYTFYLDHHTIYVGETVLYAIAR